MDQPFRPSPTPTAGTDRIGAAGAPSLMMRSAASRARSADLIAPSDAAGLRLAGAGARAAAVFPGGEIRGAQAGTLGGTIRRRRLELGWTQEQLAARISAEGEWLNQSDVSRLERGRVGLPRRARLERIAAALGLPLGDLLAHSGWAGADRAFAGAGAGRRS